MIRNPSASFPPTRSLLLSSGNSVEFRSWLARRLFFTAGKAEFISPVKSHSRGKPRKRTTGCKDAVVHGRADQDIYRVNDFNGARAGTFMRATCRYDATCYWRSCGRCYRLSRDFHMHGCMYIKYNFGLCIYTYVYKKKHVH